MSRRLTILATVILLFFAVIAAQAANLQFFRAKALDASPINPRNSQVSTKSTRGEIIAADGTVLARSVELKSGLYQRLYPLGALTAGVVGFTSPTYGTWALEAEYNTYLSSHAQPAQSVAQLLAPHSAADNIHLTLLPALQRVAARALAGRDGAVVALDPQNGDILAMYSNPTYNPVPFTSTDNKVDEAAWLKDNTKDAEGFPPLGLVATQQTFPPGSTSKVVTTAAAVALEPSLLLKSYAAATTISLPQSNKTLSNYGFTNCGGTIAEMLPPSCDTGFAEVGLDLGAEKLTEQAAKFGYNLIPPIDLPGAVASNYPTAAALADDRPGVAYSAIGQQNVRTTALENALIAGAVGNGGVMMAPHLLSYVTGPSGNVIKRFKSLAWQTPLTKDQAAQIVPLMVGVAYDYNGTAAGYFPLDDHVAAKTGTAQTGNGAHNTDDWLIAFAPSSDPTIAVAVVVPFQSVSATGASVAGPIIACVVEGALALQAGQPASGTAGTCAN